MFLHMPRPHTKIVIGGYADYLLAEGHNFIVKDGSALIEGNIFTDESIGIGTRNFVDGADVYKLSVKGKIRADAVKVYTTWAGFVFEKGYKLPSLNEVENFIKENGHLKGVPSASIVEKNGIDLGEMNKILLQKIEELTLYIIELDKEIQRLKK